MNKYAGVKLTSEAELPEDFVVLCKSVTKRRARIVIDHILKYGIITNEDLSELGYDHPPRAIRDVRENGIPLITHKIPSPKTGRKIGAYTFDDIKNIKRGRIGGRKAFSKKFKAALVARYGARDAITGEYLNERHLQIDHRVPYQVGGDGDNAALEDYMLIDSSSQRSKSWSCEHCENLLKCHDAETCKTCFWASPESYTHIAMQPKRRVEIVWSGEEVSEFDRLKAIATTEGISLQSLIKRELRK